MRTLLHATLAALSLADDLANDGLAGRERELEAGEEVVAEDLVAAGETKESQLRRRAEEEERVGRTCC